MPAFEGLTDWFRLRTQSSTPASFCWINRAFELASKYCIILSSILNCSQNCSVDIFGFPLTRIGTMLNQYRVLVDSVFSLFPSGLPNQLFFRGADRWCIVRITAESRGVWRWQTMPEHWIALLPGCMWLSHQC